MRKVSHHLQRRKGVDEGEKDEKGEKIRVPIDNTNWGCIIKIGRSIGSIRIFKRGKGSSISSIGIESSISVWSSLSTTDVSEVASVLSLMDVSDFPDYPMDHQ